MKRAYFMTTIQSTVCSAWDVLVINRHETHFKRHTWLKWNYEQL